MSAATPPLNDSPFVDIPEYIAQADPPQWGGFSEHNILLVLEAHRRFLVKTQDARLAAALTLAWATMMAASE